MLRNRLKKSRFAHGKYSNTCFELFMVWLFLIHLLNICGFQKRANTCEALGEKKYLLDATAKSECHEIVSFEHEHV